jgi:hypothetical protein
MIIPSLADRISAYNPNLKERMIYLIWQTVAFIEESWIEIIIPSDVSFLSSTNSGNS